MGMRKWIIAALVLVALLLPGSAMALTKKKFDFVVGKDGDFKAAMTAAASQASSTNRFYMFFPDGQYDVGTLTGDTNQMSTFTTANVSFIGQSMANTVLFNQSIDEGIGISATMYFKNADNLYIQDMTFLNKANYGNASTYSETGRHVAIMEQSKKVIYKNVKLLSTQDTYYTKGTKTYWENGEIHGTTDFICGSGDVFFQSCKLYEMKVSAMTAPSSTGMDWGYVFKDCTIDGDVSGFTLGRSWNNAKAVFINTTMKKLPVAGGWGDPMNSVPQVFAEYNSKDGSGNVIDLSKRRTSYTKNTTTVTLNPVLSSSEAAQYTVANVLSGTDNWQPQQLAAQVSAPVISQTGKTITWSDDANALCWAIFQNGAFVTSVTSTSFDASALTTGATITVRAANAMGGLGTSSNALILGTGVEYNLSTSVGSGQGTVSPASGKFSEGTQIVLTATPSSGWLFDHWTGDVSGSTNPLTITLSKAYSVSAVFVQDTRTFYHVQSTPQVGGTVVQTPEGSSFAEGSAVTWVATPVTAWKFLGWSGTYSGTGATYSVPSLMSDVDLTPIFRPIDNATYQAEDGVLSNAVIESKNSGFAGTGYVNFNAVLGANLTLPVYADVAGNTELTLTYSNGSGVTRSLSVSVDGVVQLVAVDFLGTANWTTWSSQTITLNLPVGGSVITFSTVDGQDGPNLDQVYLAQQAVSLGKMGGDSSPLAYRQIVNVGLLIPVPVGGEWSVQLFDLSGHIVGSKRSTDRGVPGQVLLPTDGLTRGIYLLEYRGANAVWSSSVMIW